MPTDEERREVARRLRETGDGLGRSALLWYHIAKALGVRTATDGKAACGMLADLIEPNRGSGGRTILCAHCESASWCGCEPGDEQGGCDFEPSVTEGEPPHNLYSLYEAVLRRHPRDEYAIEDDEVDELVDALLDICNSPGHEHIQRPQSSEPKVRCMAEVNVDGERLEKLVHDAVVEATGIDHYALLALADEFEAGAKTARARKWNEPANAAMAIALADEYEANARRIREALGVADG